MIAYDFNYRNKLCLYKNVGFFGYSAPLFRFYSLVEPVTGPIVLFLMFSLINLSSEATSF